MNINLNYIKKIKFDLKSPKHCSHETFILVHELHLRGLLHPKSLESSKGRKEEESTSRTSTSVAWNAARKGEKAERAPWRKGFKKRGCTLVPPFQSTGRRGSRTWHTSLAPWSRCKKRGARLISRELNLPSLTTASGRKSSEFDPGGIPWLSRGIVRERGAR